MKERVYFDLWSQREESPSLLEDTEASKRHSSQGAGSWGFTTFSTHMKQTKLKVGQGFQLPRSMPSDVLPLAKLHLPTISLGFLLPPPSWINAPTICRRSRTTQAWDRANWKESKASNSQGPSLVMRFFQPNWTSHNLSRQSHQLETKYSNTWASGGHSPCKPSQELLNVFALVES